jgi:hypothetical protein
MGTDAKIAPAKALRLASSDTTTMMSVVAANLIN